MKNQGHVDYVLEELTKGGTIGRFLKSPEKFEKEILNLNNLDKIIKKAESDEDFDEAQIFKYCHKEALTNLLVNDFLENL